MLLQSATDITKCDNFITKCDRYFKVRRLLQSAKVHTTKDHLISDKTMNRHKAKGKNKRGSLLVNPLKMSVARFAESDSTSKS